MKNKSVLLLAAVLTAQNGFVVVPFEANGIRGAYALPDERVVVMAQPSSCDVEAMTFRVRLRRPDKPDFRLVVESRPVTRCQMEAASVTFFRDRAERPILITVQELKVTNGASAPIDGGK